MKTNFFNYFVTVPIFEILKIINSYTNNWGFSIIILTILIKIITYPLNKIQYISTLKLNLLKPKLKYINNKYKDENLKNKEIMKLYKEENINPTQGLLLILIQTPIFFSLYKILTDFKEFNNASFVYWIKDLSSKDPYYILPVLMGISILFIQIFSPNNDTKFNIIVFFIPILFTFCFLWIPSGLVIYYLTNNILTLLQQFIIYKEFLRNNNINSKKLNNNG